MAKSNFQGGLIINVALLRLIGEDPEFGQKLEAAVKEKMFDATAKGTVEYNGLPAVQVVTVHPANMVNLIASGGNVGRDLGPAGAIENMKEGNERDLLGAGAENYGLVVRSEAHERDPEAKAATAAKARKTREETAKRKLEQAVQAKLEQEQQG